MKISPRVPCTFLLAFALALVAGACAHDGLDARPAGAPSTVFDQLGIGDAQLEPGFWVARLKHPDWPLLSSDEIDAQNRRLFAQDESMHDLQAMPASLGRERVSAWLAGVSSRPGKDLYDAGGNLLSPALVDRLLQQSNPDGIPLRQVTRFGLVVRRTPLRTFPGSPRAFAAPGDLDIDRFQESALFPGTPVVIAHESLDHKWLFVMSPNYVAWLASDDVAEGPRDVVLGYAATTPFRVVTGARVTTVHAPELPGLSRLELDMGVRLPLVPGPAGQPVNGQNPYTSWPIQLPVRGPDGSLALAPALVQKNTDTHAGYLALTRANIIRQAFKFLGERYGWGHDYDGRDCSGFVSEVYRSMGVELPRNTGDQAASPAFDRQPFSATTTLQERQAAVARMVPGDLVYIPGHVMMVIGHFEDRTYVIHDTSGGTVLLPDGTLAALHLNAVAVTPLEPLRFNDTESYIERITSVVHIGGRK